MSLEGNIAYILTGEKTTTFDLDLHSIQSQLKIYIKVYLKLQTTKF